MSRRLPNIVYLNSHDTGRWLGCYDAPVKTPAIDRLAAEGVLFERVFCTAPTCSPSRSSLLTGQAPHSVGVFGNVGRGFQISAPEHHLANHLRGHGYHTAHIGVFSVAPTGALGYEEILDSSDDVDEAERFLLDPQRQQKPFFLDVGFVETHRGPGRDKTSFFPENQARDLTPCPWKSPPYPLPDTEEVRKDLADFAHSVSSLDRRVESVLAALQTSGLAGNTLVIYTVDHGPPFPEMKGTLSDRGIGVAMVFRGPEGSPFTGGCRNSDLISQIDIYPTLCEWLEIDSPPWLQGCSFLPCVRTENPISGQRAVFAEQTFHAAYEPLRAIRTADWKLIQAFHDYPWKIAANVDDGPSKASMLDTGWSRVAQQAERLYYLREDPLETNNLANDPRCGTILAALRERLAEWMRKTEDPLLNGPIPLPPGIRPVSPSALSPWEGR